MENYAYNGTSGHFNWDLKHRLCPRNVGRLHLCTFFRGAPQRMGNSYGHHDRAPIRGVGTRIDGSLPLSERIEKPYREKKIR